MWTRYKWSPWEIEELRLLAHRVGIATTGLDRSPLGNTIADRDHQKIGR